jgi:hypothetical protein
MLWRVVVGMTCFVVALWCCSDVVALCCGVIDDVAVA